MARRRGGRHAEGGARGARTGGGRCGRGDLRRLVFAAAVLLAAGTVPTAQTQSYEVITTGTCGEEVTSLGDCQAARDEFYPGDEFVDLSVCDKDCTGKGLADCFGVSPITLRIENVDYRVHTYTYCQNHFTLSYPKKCQSD